MTLRADDLAFARRNVSWGRLSLAAWIALGAHLAAGLATAFILRPGLETNPDLPSRLRYIADNEALWIAGWLVWNAAALSILYFYACFVAAHDGGQPESLVLRLGLLLSVAGIVPDLTAEAIEMGLLPRLAEQALDEKSSSNAALFLAVHRGAVMATGYVANGLYSLSALLLVWSTRGSYTKWIVGSGLIVAAAGLFLSAAVLADSVQGMVAAHFVLVPALLLWQAGVALDAARRARQADGGAANR
jgi:hypothetical protein